MTISSSEPADVPLAISGTGHRVVTGGIVAYNDEGRIEQSIRSLLGQELPVGTEWGHIWVVASGCTDRTVEVTRTLSVEDPRVSLLVEAERHGKAAAILEVLRRAEGEYLVLLNSDAVAAPGSVAALLAKAVGKPRPFAVMARPTVPTAALGRWSETMRWMWDLHHELHLEMLANGDGAHLSDELLLVSLPVFPWIKEGIINDGSYCAVWLRKNFGGCWYASDARVVIDIPTTPGNLLRQRRRILVGNAQVAALLGRPPTTAFRFMVVQPLRALRALRRALAREHGFRHLLRVATWELIAYALAAWDRLPPRRDHVLWSRITPTPTSDARDSNSDAMAVPEGPSLEGRIQVIVEVAREFGTGVPLAQLAGLLPTDSIGGPAELEAFLARRPDLATVVGHQAYPPSGSPPSGNPDRTTRGVQYRRAAWRLVAGPLAWLRPLTRCIGLTGSAAYGEPAPGDDLDFFVVTRAGALPWFLAATYLTLRFRWRDPALPPACFNYVVDERRAPADLAGGRGLLFAREALSVQMIHGDAYYRGLLARAPWLGVEIPRLFKARTANRGDSSPRPAPLLVRLLSATMYPPLAAYLQLMGLRRNARARRSGHTSDTFRTLTAPDRVAFQSRRFEELRARYEKSAEAVPIKEGVATPSRIPTAR